MEKEKIEKLKIEGFIVTKEYHSRDYWVYRVKRPNQPEVRFHAIKSYITSLTTPQQLAEKLRYHTESLTGKEQQRLNNSLDLIMKRGAERRKLAGL